MSRKTNLASLEGVSLLKLLLVLILIDQDEIDPPHAIVEEQRIRLVVELRLRAKTSRVRQNRWLEIVLLFLHFVVHDELRLEGAQCV